jgi:hypothetical protein
MDGTYRIWVLTAFVFLFPKCGQGDGPDPDAVNTPVEPRLVLSESVFPASTDCEYPGKWAGDCPNPQFATFTLTYNVGQETRFDPSGSIALVQAYPYNGEYRTEPIYTAHFGWPVPQTDNPHAPNFTTATVLDNPLGPVNATARMSDEQKLIVSFDNPVGPGARIEILFGDRSRGSPGFLVATLPLDIDIYVEEDPENDGVFSPVSGEMPTLRVVGTRLDRFAVIAPSTPSSREFEIIVKAMQGSEGMRTSTFVNQSYLGTIRFDSTDPGAILPDDYTFTSEDEGVRAFRVTLPGPDIQTVFVAEIGSGVSGFSNPIRTDPGRHSLYWGILQQHTNIGGHALQTPQFAFEYGRDAAGLDFLALTEHCGKVHFDWPYSCAVADGYNQPGKFVTFCGYEWSSRSFGHRHVVFLDGQKEDCFCHRDIPNPTTRAAESLEDLLLALEGRQALTIPHHTAWVMAQGKQRPTSSVILGEKNHPNQILFEIYSHHGSSEKFDNAPYIIKGDVQRQFEDGIGYFQNALAAGYEFGVTSGTDDHQGKPGGQVAPNQPGHMGSNYSRKGITAVYATGLTRKSLWEGLTSRRTYGTTGARIYVDFHINGHPMGGEISTTRPPEIRVEVAGTAVIDEISILRNGLETIKTVDPGTDRAAFSFVDLNVVAGEKYSYYVRIVQEDGHIAWSSPIWVSVQRTATAGSRAR